MNPKDKAEKAYEDTVAMTKLNKEIDMLGVGLKLEKVNRELFPDKPTDEIERRAEESLNTIKPTYITGDTDQHLYSEESMRAMFAFGHSAAKEEVEDGFRQEVDALYRRELDRAHEELDALKSQNAELRSLLNEAVHWLGIDKPRESNGVNDFMKRYLFQNKGMT